MMQSTPHRSPDPPHDAGRKEPDDLARLTGELCHDLNDGLLTLAALADFAAAEASEGRSTLSSIAQIREVCRQLRYGLRDVSEAMQGRSPSADLDFDPCAVARAAYDHWLITAPALEASVRCDLRPGTRIRGPASFFYRAVWNLLRNAGRHARREVRMRIHAVESPAGMRVELSLEDDGFGVPPDLRPIVFEPYVRTAGGGSGLGLSVVSWAVRRLSGSVELAEPGSLGGARFIISLPSTTSRHQVAARRADGSQVSLEGRRIAVVDDNPTIRKMLNKLLSREGAVAIEFVPADHPAADTLAQVLASSDLDLILLDVEMGPFNGLIVWRALQQHAPAVAERVLFLSGYVYDSVEAVPALAERWVTKEGTWEVIRQAIQNQLAKQI
jgi:two-component system, sensor histidine kinase